MGETGELLLSLAKVVNVKSKQELQSLHLLTV